MNPILKFISIFCLMNIFASATDLSQQCIDQFSAAALERHNFHRGKHSAPDLALDNQISEIANEYASRLNQLNSFDHNPRLTDLNLGENLWEVRSTGRFDSTNLEACKKFGIESTDSWYEEIKYIQTYDESSLQDKRAGHFTQLVWRESTKLGVGIHLRQSSEGYRVVVVANYRKPGNLIGTYVKNVQPPSNSESDDAE